MKQVFIKKGQSIVEEVPAAIARENEVLVKVHYSCISTGTEMAGIRDSGTPLYKKALNQPKNIKKAMALIKRQGFTKTSNYIKGITENLQAVGYSASGIVLETGNKINDIASGTRVACAGAGIANHAEFISVPRNLIVKVPKNLSLELASTITLGSIAMQGVRRTEPGLGEFVAVIGLGILGQLTSQMLKSMGCRVIGVDLEQKRIDMATSLGMDKGLNPAEDDIVNEAIRFSDGYGVDSVVLTAFTKSSDVINQSMEMCRKKGKVVIVGAVGLNIGREEFYKKELDVLISTSYGPGRYDENYEQKGKDYPYAYVRWTENRNMQEYLRLLADNKVNITPLIEKVYNIEKAPEAYEELKNGSSKPLIVLLEYNKESVPERKIVVSKKKIPEGKINTALVGAGGFAKGTHLPNLKKLDTFYNIYAICDTIGSNANNTAKRYNALYATTDFNEILKDKNVNAVVISTRHNLHAQMVLQFLKAGKHILVEKPLAVTQEELSQIKDLYTLSKKPLPILLVGFNRRFSPYARKIKEFTEKRGNPMVINYRMNAGFIPKTHWVHTEEGGGRNIGEACHIYDLFNFFTGSEFESVSAFSIEPKTDQYAKNDNFVATIKYKDGSVCNLIYTALGSSEVPKEQMEIYVDGKIIHLNDYKELKVFGARKYEKNLKVQDKGHYQELIEFANGIKKGNNYPIPLWQLIQAMEISFEVERILG